MVQTEFWPLFQALQPSKSAADVTSLSPSLKPNPFNNYLVQTDVSKNDRQRTTFIQQSSGLFSPWFGSSPNPQALDGISNTPLIVQRDLQLVRAT